MTHDWLDDGLLGRVRAIVGPWRCHLVGGAVRDHLLGRPARDLDLVVAGGGLAATTLAARLEARLIPLGGDRFAAVRLVGTDAAGDFVIDIWDRGASTMTEELGRRDLTINSIAVDLGDGVWHDPLGGKQDVEARVLRAATDDSFQRDPLRVLRLARFAAELTDFSVESRTVELAAKAVDRLVEVAAERRREEFVRTMRTPRPERAVELWERIGFYPAVVGGRGEDKAALAAGEAMMRARSHRSWFEGSSPHLDHFALNAAVLLAAAGVDPQVLLDDGYISRREARDIALVLPHRQLPTGVAEQRWLLHQSAEQWPAAVCHAAVWDTELPAQKIRLLLRRMAALVRSDGEAIFRPEPLLRGDEIRRLLGLAAGPEVGVVAKKLRRRQVEGRLHDHGEAIDWLLSERR